MSVGLWCCIASTAFAVQPEKPKIVILAKNFSGYTSNIAKSIELSSLSTQYTINSERLENWKPDSKVKLYIALGNESLESLQDASVTQPVLGGLITSNQWQQFKQKHPSTKFNAVFYDPDPVRQIVLAKILSPLIKTVGVMRSEQYYFDEQSMQITAVKNNVNLNLKINNKAERFYREYADLSNKNDVILLIPDRANYNRNTISKAILTSYRQGKIVIGYSKGSVKAGALATSFTSSDDYIQDLTESSQELLSSPSIKIQRFSSYYNVATNKEVAKSLGIPLNSDEALESSIKATIKKMVKDTNIDAD